MDLHGLARHPLRGSAYVGLEHRRLQRPFTLGHQPGHLVRELARRLDEYRHPGELGLGELVIGDGLAEDHPVGGVVRGRLVRRLHHPDGAGRGLKPAVLEPRHLEVEAATDALRTADQIGGGDEPVLEGDLVGVHSPVAEGVDRTTLHPPRRVAAGFGRGVLGEDESIAVAAVLLDDEQRQSSVGLGPVGIGTGQEHEHIRSSREGAPRLHAVDQPSAFGACRGQSRWRPHRSRSRAP